MTIPHYFFFTTYSLTDFPTDSARLSAPPPSAYSPACPSSISIIHYLPALPFIVLLPPLLLFIAMPIFIFASRFVLMISSFHAMRVRMA